MEKLIYVLFGMCFILALCCVVLLRDVSGIRRTAKDARNRLETLETAFDNLEDRQNGVENRLHDQSLRIDTKAKTLTDYIDRVELDVKSHSDENLKCAYLDISDILERVSHLEKGMVPDFEAAKAAVKSVNDFNSGLSAIMNFDPMAAAKQQRSERTTAGGGADGV